MGRDGVRPTSPALKERRNGVRLPGWEGVSSRFMDGLLAGMWNELRRFFRRCGVAVEGCGVLGSGDGIGDAIVRGRRSRASKKPEVRRCRQGTVGRGGDRTRRWTELVQAIAQDLRGLCPAISFSDAELLEEESSSMHCEVAVHEQMGGDRESELRQTQR